MSADWVSNTETFDYKAAIFSSNTPKKLLLDLPTYSSLAQIHSSIVTYHVGFVQRRHVVTKIISPMPLYLACETTVRYFLSNYDLQLTSQLGAAIGDETQDYSQRNLER